VDIFIDILEPCSISYVFTSTPPLGVIFHASCARFVVRLFISRWAQRA